MFQPPPKHTLPTPARPFTSFEGSATAHAARRSPGGVSSQRHGAARRVCPNAWNPVAHGRDARTLVRPPPSRAHPKPKALSTVAGGRWTPASYPRLPQLAQPPQRQLAQLSAARLRLTACPPPKPRRPPRVSRHRLGAAPPLQLASRGWARVRREEKARDGKEAAEGGGLDADAEGAAVEGLRREQLERVAKPDRGARDLGRA